MTRRRPPAPWVQALGQDCAGASSETILDQVRGAILAGQAPPGSTIHVDDVAERFVVSRIPVREALKTLVGESLVEHRPGEGYTVARVTRTELAEFYLVREALEGAALAAAVARATDEDDREVRAAFAALTRALEAGDTAGHHRESRRFHMALAAPCRMHRLLRMFESAWNITEPLRPMSWVDAETAGRLHDDDHRRMLGAFLARDGEALVAESREHYRHLQRVVAQLPDDEGLFG